MTMLLVSLADAAIVLGVGLAVAVMARRGSASLRHAVLASAIGCALLMPVFEMWLPQLPVVRVSVSETWSSGATLGSDAITIPFATVDSPRRQAGMSWIQWLAALWVSGAIVMAVSLAASFFHLRRLKARCVPVTGRWRELTDELAAACGINRRVRLLQSDRAPLLVTCGLIQPAIILPAGSASWSDDRRRAVLRHELAHIQRQDVAVQLIGEVLRVVQWINPLVWVACRRLRQESEYACDDAVLSSGVEPTEYAAHLLAIARHLSGRQFAWPSATAIAHPSTLERRIVAMLHQRNRAPLGAWGWSIATLAVVGVSLPLAAMGVSRADLPAAAAAAAPDVTLAATASVPEPLPRPMAPPVRAARPTQQALGTIGGTVLDPTGATLPGAQFTLTHANTGSQVTVASDVAGRFTAANLAAGDYEVVARLPGFATVTNRVKLLAGAKVEGTLTMPLGTLTETITVACAAASPAVQRRFPGNASFPMSEGRALPVSDAQPIRVGGSLRAPKKLTDVRPSCPSAPAAEQNVRLTARLGTDGSVFDTLAVQAPGPAPAKEFVDAAIDAVRGWKFTPTLLNGQLMEVAMTVDVKFLPQ